MTCNIGRIERVLRGLVGLGLIAFALFGAQTAYGAYAIWGWIGLIPLATAIVGWCPPYALLGICTCGTKAPKTGSST